MANKRNTYNFENIYNQGTEPRKSQGSDAYINKFKYNVLIKEMDFLNNLELIQDIENFSEVQEVPKNLSNVISIIYRVFTQDFIKEDENSVKD